MPKNIDPVDIRKLVKDGKLEFYVEGDNIYCRELPINGELFIVGKVETLSLKGFKGKVYSDCEIDCKHHEDGICLYHMDCTRLGIDYYEKK